MQVCAGGGYGACYERDGGIESDFAWTNLVYASSIILARFTKALIFIDVAILSAPPGVTTAPVATSLGQHGGLGRDLDRLGFDKTHFFTTRRKFCVMNGLVLK